MVGVGHSDEYVMRIAKGFGMQLLAFDSAEAVERILDMTAANIKAFRGGTPQNQVHT